MFWFPLYAPAFGIQDLPQLPFHHALGAFGPMLAALISVFVFTGKAGGMQFLKKFIQPGPMVFLLIAVFAPFLLAAIAMLTGYFANGIPFDFTLVLRGKEFPEYNFISLFLYNLVFFGYGEEAGWRGFALPRLQKKMRPLYAALLLGIFWAIWHWPLFLYRPGYMEMGFSGITGWIFSLLTGSVLLSWLYAGSKGSILICAIFHSTIDIVFTGNTGPEFTGHLGMLITFWGIATGFLLWRKKTVFAKPDKTQFSG